MIDKKGVSEVIGFVIIFGIVLTAIGIVYFNAIPAFDNTRESTHLRNVENSFSVLHDNINDIAQESAPSRSTQILLRQDQLSIGKDNETRIKLTVNSTKRADKNVSPIIYEKNNQMYVYENGAVIRASEEGSAMLRDPNIFKKNATGTKTVFVPIIKTVGDESIGGVQTVQIETIPYQPPETEIIEPSSPVNVSITVESQHCKAWRSYFDDLDTGTVTSCTNNEVTLEISNVDRVIYQVHFMQVSFE